MMKSLVAAVSILASLLFGLTPVAAQTCLRDNVAGQRAEGRLTLGRYRDAADRPQSAYILLLTAPTCLASDDPDYRVKSTQKIHIHSSSDKIHATIQRHVGATIRVHGKPYSAHTAHHHAPIVFDVSKIARR